MREDYPGFDDWFDKCAREHRDCWVVEVGNELAGIVVRKDESHADANTRHSGPKILKVCTFKMKPDFRGEKFGEQLLKQILWYAQRNGYDLIYLTAFPGQTVLIDLLCYYGFGTTNRQENGELVLEKALLRGALPHCSGDVLSCDREHYPRFYAGPSIRKFCVPIRAPYHAKLFPEIAVPSALLPLFPADEFGPMLLAGPTGDRTPGNTIRKVYLCRAKTKALRAGDLLLFYMSKDKRFRASQSITTVGVVEQVSEALSLEKVVKLTVKRSVFSEDELRVLMSAKNSPLKVIDFLLIGHVEPAVALDTLLSNRIFSNRPPQSIFELDSRQFERLRQHLDLGFEFG